MTRGLGHMWAGEPPEGERLWGEHVGLDQIAAAERGYESCGPAEQLLWERLSVFEGAFGREAVREVCASGTLPAGEVQAVLDRLAPLALLPVDDLFDGEDGLPRYWMPHPMRAVGARRLTARGDRWAVLLNHRRWCVKVARRAAEWWQRGRQLDARDLALRELPDLAAAMDPTTAPLRRVPRPTRPSRSRCPCGSCGWSAGGSPRAAPGCGTPSACTRGRRPAVPCGSPPSWSWSRAAPRTPIRSSPRPGRRPYGTETNAAWRSSPICAARPPSTRGVRGRRRPSSGRPSP
ncbi:hypothetical protein O1L60_17605 [Streptomyces diastatochromogenes]|nr:hypothetical protein [Streptomyces diastatochromogenes]